MKLSRYVLAICVLVLAFTPFISNAAEIGGCNLDPQKNTCTDNTCDLNGCTQAECDQSVCDQNTCINQESCNLNSDAFNMNDILSQLKLACTK